MKLTDKIVVLFSIMYIPILLLAQAPDTLWTKTYGGDDYDFGRDICITADSGYIILGSTESYGAGQNDLLLINVDSIGNVVWIKTYGYAYGDHGYSIAPTLDNGYIITGQVEYSIPAADVWLLKTNAQGDTLWTKIYGTNNGDDWGVDVKQTSDSGYVIVGTTGSFGAGYWDIWLLKTDANGDTLWTKTFGSSVVEEGVSVIQTADGGFIIVGITEIGGAANYDLWLIKVNAQGDTLWTKTYGGSNDDVGYKIQATNDSAYVIIGTTRSFGSGSYDIWLLKIDSLGDTLWTKTYGSSGWDEGYSIMQTHDNGYIISGFTGDIFEANGCLIKIDSSGSVLWSLVLGDSLFDCLRSVMVLPGNSYVSVGHTYSYGHGQYMSDVWLIKTAPDTLCITEVEKDIIDDNHLFVFPNPVKKEGTIRYRILKNSYVDISIYDVSGQLIRIVDRSYHTAGNYCKRFDAQKLTNGIYFIRLRTPERSYIKKIIVIN